jgi:NitT/TauT family transport system substrate-binding protein
MLDQVPRPTPAKPSLRRSPGLKRAVCALSAAALVASCLTACGGSAAGKIKANGKIVISFSQLVPENLPLWIAADKGIFKKNGVNVEVKYITGQTGLQTLLSGQTQIAAIGAAEGVSAAAQGAKLQYFAALAPVFTFILYSSPEIKDAKALAGQRVGITSATGSVGIATKVALQKLGVDLGKVTLSPLGEVPNVNAALVKGAVKAAVSHPPGSLAFKAKGLNPLLDMAAQHIPYATVAMVGQSSFLTSNKALVQKITDSLTEAAQVERTDRTTAMQVLKTRLKLSDDQTAEQTYDFYSKEVLPAKLNPDVSQLKTAQDVLGARDQKVRGLDLNGLVNGSFVK